MMINIDELNRFERLLNKEFAKAALVKFATDRFVNSFVTFLDQLESEGFVGDAAVDIIFKVKPDKSFLKNEKNKPADVVTDAKHVVEILKKLKNFDNENGNCENENCKNCVWKIGKMQKSQSGCTTCDNDEIVADIVADDTPTKVEAVSMTDDVKKPMPRDKVYSFIYDTLTYENTGEKPITPSAATLEKYANMLADVVASYDGIITLDKETREFFADRYGCSEDNVYRSFKKLGDCGILWKLSEDNETSRFSIRPDLFSDIKDAVRDVPCSC